MVFINHTETIKDKIVVIEINGALSSETSAGFEEYIDQLLANKKVLIIIDARNLEFVSSVGIGAVLYTQKKIMANNGFIVICNLSEEITSLYKLLGFDKVFEIASTKEDAVQIMEKQLELRSGDQPVDETADAEATYYEEDEAGEIDDYEPVIDEEEEIAEFENPIILECPECKCMIRINRIGSYICPDCKAEFSVDEDQTVTFK